MVVTQDPMQRFLPHAGSFTSALAVLYSNAIFCASKEACISRQVILCGFQPNSEVVCFEKKKTLPCFIATHEKRTIWCLKLHGVCKNNFKETWHICAPEKPSTTQYRMSADVNFPNPQIQAQGTGR